MVINDALRNTCWKFHNKPIVLFTLVKTVLMWMSKDNIESKYSQMFLWISFTNWNIVENEQLEATLAWTRKDIFIPTSLPTPIINFQSFLLKFSSVNSHFHHSPSFVQSSTITSYELRKHETCLTHCVIRNYHFLVFLY